MHGEKLRRPHDSLACRTTFSSITCSNCFLYDFLSCQCGGILSQSFLQCCFSSLRFAGVHSCTANLRFHCIFIRLYVTGQYFSFLFQPLCCIFAVLGIVVLFQGPILSQALAVRHMDSYLTREYFGMQRTHGRLNGCKVTELTLQPPPPLCFTVGMRCLC